MLANANKINQGRFVASMVLAVAVSFSVLAVGLASAPGTAYADSGTQRVVSGTMTITMKSSDDGGTTPDDGGETPDDGGTTPDDGGTTPDDGGTTPDDGGKTPDDGGTTPDDDTPDGDKAIPDDSGVTPDNGAATSGGDANAAADEAASGSSASSSANAMAATGDELAWLAFGSAILAAAGAYLLIRGRRFATNSGAHAACTTDSSQQVRRIVAVAVSAILVASLCFGAFFTRSTAFAQETLNDVSASSAVVVDENGKVISSNLKIANGTDSAAYIVGVSAPTELSAWSANVDAQKELDGGKQIVSDWNGESIPASVLDKVKADGSATLEFTVTVITDTTVFAVYSATDGGLDFYQRYVVPEVGDTFEGKAVTQVYTGFENEEYGDYTGKLAPWLKDGVAENIKSATVVDEGIKVNSLACWFMYLENLESVDLSKLDTSELGSTDFMFNGCSSLKTFDAGSIDFSNVKSARYMFAYADNLETVENSGNITCPSLTDAEGMFLDCEKLSTLDLSNMDTSNVVKMHGVFYYCSALTEVKGLEDWDTSSATDMSSMFCYCNALNANLRGWNVANCTSHDNFHDGASGVLSPFDVLDFDKFTVDTSAVTYSGSQIKPNVSTPTYVKIQEYEVVYGDNVNAGLGTVTVRGVNGWQGEKTYTFTINKADAVPSASLDESYDLLVNDSLSSIELPVCTNGTYAWASPDQAYDKEGAYDVSVNFTPSDTRNYNAVTLTAKVNVKAPTAFAIYSAGDGNSLTFYNRLTVPKAGEVVDGKVATSVYTGFGQTEYASASEVPWVDAVASIKTVNVVDSGIAVSSLSYWFANAANLESVDLSKFDTSKLKSVDNLFNGCSSLASFDAGSVEFANVLRLSQMFRDCSSLMKIDNANKITCANNSDVYAMFYGCSSLTSLDLSGFNTTKCSSYSYMFKDCGKLQTIAGLEKWDTTDVEYMSYTFDGCASLKADLRDWKVDNVVKHENFNENAPGVMSPFDLDFDKFTVDTSAVTYDGTQKKPSVESTKYKAGDQYEVSYGDNVKAGTGSVTITGVNGFSGTKTYTFTINQAVPTPSSALPMTYNIAKGMPVMSAAGPSIPLCEDGQYTWVDPYQSWSESGTYTTKIVYTPYDEDNYSKIYYDVTVNVS